jgi:hypothetical protein
MSSGMAAARKNVGLRFLLRSGDPSVRPVRDQLSLDKIPAMFLPDKFVFIPD